MNKNKLFLTLFLISSNIFAGDINNCASYLTGSYRGGVFTLFYDSFSFNHKEGTGMTTLVNDKDEKIEVDLESKNCKFKMNKESIAAADHGSLFPGNLSGSSCDLMIKYEISGSSSKQSCNCSFKNRGFENLSIRNFISCNGD